MKLLSARRLKAASFFFAVALASVVCSCGRRSDDKKAAALRDSGTTTIQWLDHVHCGISADEYGNPLKVPVIGEKEQHIVDLIVGMPSWATVPYGRGEREEIAKMEQAIQEIASYDLDTIRTALVYYCLVGFEHEDHNHATFDRDCKTLLLNKFLFNLPLTVRRDSPHDTTFGGSWGIPDPGSAAKPMPFDQIPIRWPWSETEPGTWHITARLNGCMGEQYQPIVAFDYYRKNFGKRDMTRNRKLSPVGP